MAKKAFEHAAEDIDRFVSELTDEQWDALVAARERIVHEKYRTMIFRRQEPNNCSF